MRRSSVRNKQRGFGSFDIFAAMLVGTVGVGIADTKTQQAIPADAPKCVMERVQAPGANYYFDRQKPGICKL